MTIVFMIIGIFFYIFFTVPSLLKKEKSGYNIGSNYKSKKSNVDFELLVDFGDEVVLLRKDINIRILVKKVNFDKDWSKK